ncbi:hypothetical protein TanjilG_22699 [Lupinus angustifolius]|uniref:UBC core domain-containing protein n=1 Tax=Lupinus angustifolius TaxID=3871 RepID=A0A1J7GFB3_LUPAN|nr:hypothetical protein TanjilG_22699 [Lupinus angustifolius]
MANSNLPRRIIKETQRLLSEPAPGISASPSEDNMRYFNVMILGPTQSPYEEDELSAAIRLLLSDREAPVRILETAFRLWRFICIRSNGKTKFLLVFYKLLLRTCLVLGIRQQPLKF